MTIDLTDPIFSNEDAARKHFEAIRWPNGPTCPHCGVVDQATMLKGKSHRHGMYQCNACREPFTVTVGSVMESSHVPLHKWALGFHLMASSKKGVSANQLMRNLGLGSYRTAWFMAHRIREAMRPSEGALAPMGGAGGIVEVDETFIGTDRTRKPKGSKKGRGYAHKHKVLSLVDRDTGQKRSMVVDDLSAKTLVPILIENIAAETRVMTDEAGQYGKLSAHFAGHGVTHHGQGEYVNLLDRTIHTNSIEGAFSVFKRGMKGVYQHCGKQHLHRYVAEFDFRYSNRVRLGVDDTERASRAIKGAVGKRLTYKQSGPAQPFSA